jgi:metallophosphoesterase (TIGR00282 family)
VPRFSPTREGYRKASIQHVTEKLKALILGDVVGQPGCRALFVGLADLVKSYGADIVVVNGENAADGFGMKPEIAERFFESGVHAITSGNHIWQRREIFPMLQTHDRLLRPENYPAGVPGKGHCLVSVRDIPVLVANLEGRVNLSPLRCPISVGKALIKQFRSKVKVILVDFHAESVDEKEAFALSIDGEVSAVLGTHTHVQTADERILSRGTAYITDIGMIGPSESVIGMKRETAILRCLSQMPLKMEVQNSPAEIMGVFVEIDAATGKAVRIERVRQQSPI